MKLPFFKKKDQSVLPQEIQNYYQTEQRDNTTRAWLTVFGVLLAAVLLITGLFYSGRWAYRELTQDNGNTESQVQQDPNQALDLDFPANTDDNDNTVNEPTNTPDTDEQNQTGTSSTNTGDVASDSDLPNTGPADLLGLFAIVVLLSTSAHYALNNRN